MYNERHKRMKKIIVGQSLVASGIILLASCLIFYAMGYRINFKNYTINKIGILSLAFVDHPESITIDGKEYKNGNNFYIGLTPGNYQVTAKKEGHHDWHSEYYIKSGLVEKQENIIFIEKEPNIEETSDQGIINRINSPNTSLATSDKRELSHNDYEMWLGKDLLTRYSENIQGVKWFPGNSYIAFQMGSEIRIIDKRGKNDTLLVKLENPSITKFAFKSNGRELYYRDGSKYYIAEIR